MGKIKLICINELKSSTDKQGYKIGTLHSIYSPVISEDIILNNEYYTYEFLNNEYYTYGYDVKCVHIYKQGTGYIGYVDSSYFMTLAEYRENRINKILNGN